MIEDFPDGCPDCGHKILLHTKTISHNVDFGHNNTIVADSGKTHETLVCEECGWGCEE